MPIDVICPGCGKKAKVPDAAAGKNAKCPACKAVVKVPVPGDKPVLTPVQADATPVPAIAPIPPLEIFSTSSPILPTTVDSFMATPFDSMQFFANPVIGDPLESVMPAVTLPTPIETQPKPEPTPSQTKEPKPATTQDTVVEDDPFGFLQQQPTAAVEEAEPNPFDFVAEASSAPPAKEKLVPKPAEAKPKAKPKGVILADVPAPVAEENPFGFFEEAASVPPTVDKPKTVEKPKVKSKEITPNVAPAPVAEENPFGFFEEVAATPVVEKPKVKSQPERPARVESAKVKPTQTSDANTKKKSNSPKISTPPKVEPAPIVEENPFAEFAGLENTIPEQEVVDTTPNEFQFFTETTPQPVVPEPKPQTKPAPAKPKVSTPAPAAKTTPVNPIKKVHPAPKPKPVVPTPKQNAVIVEENPLAFFEQVEHASIEPEPILEDIPEALIEETDSLFAFDAMREPVVEALPLIEELLIAEPIPEAEPATHFSDFPSSPAPQIEKIPEPPATIAEAITPILQDGGEDLLPVDAIDALLGTPKPKTETSWLDQIIGETNSLEPIAEALPVESIPEAEAVEEEAIAEPEKSIFDEDGSHINPWPELVDAATHVPVVDAIPEAEALLPEAEPIPAPDSWADIEEVLAQSIPIAELPPTPLPLDPGESWAKWSDADIQLPQINAEPTVLEALPLEPELEPLPEVKEEIVEPIVADQASIFGHVATAEVIPVGAGWESTIFRLEAKQLAEDIPEADPIPEAEPLEEKREIDEHNP